MNLVTNSSSWDIACCLLKLEKSLNLVVYEVRVVQKWSLKGPQIANFDL